MSLFAKKIERSCFFKNLSHHLLHLYSYFAAEIECIIIKSNVRMEKNIKKRMCRLALVVIAVLVVFFNFLSYFCLCS